MTRLDNLTDEELDAIEEMVESCGERSLRYLADEAYNAMELKMQMSQEE